MAKKIGRILPTPFGFYVVDFKAKLVDEEGAQISKDRTSFVERNWECSNFTFLPIININNFIEIRTVLSPKTFYCSKSV